MAHLSSVMQSAVLLRCPLCDAVCALEGQRSEYSKKDLYSRAKIHLRDHGLDEPKMAIRKYGIATDTTEIVVSPERHRQLPISEWIARDDAWLPDGVLSGGDAALATSESPVETSSL